MKNKYEEFHDLQAELDKLEKSGIKGNATRRQLRQLRDQYLSPLAQSRIDYQLKLQRRMALRLVYSFMCLLAVFMIFAGFWGLFSLTRKAYEKPLASEELFLEAIDDYQTGNYRETIRKLSACVDASSDGVGTTNNFNGFVVYQYLADSYYALGQVDEAVRVTASYLKEIYGTVNIETRNVLYKRVLTWLPEASEVVQAEFAKFLADAERYSSLYEELRVIARNPNKDSADRRVLELKQEGAANPLFYELYANFSWKLNKAYTLSYEEILELITQKDTYHSRLMTFDERVSILIGLNELYANDSDGLLSDDLLSDNLIPDDLLSDFLTRSDEFSSCGTGITDVDPLTGRDINGKLKDSTALFAEAKELMQEYDYIRSNPYLVWEERSFFSNGNEIIHTTDQWDAATGLGKSEGYHDYSYSWMDGLIYQSFGYTDYSSQMSLLHYAQLNTGLVLQPEKLIGTWKSDIQNTSPIIVVRNISFSDNTDESAGENEAVSSAGKIPDTSAGKTPGTSASKIPEISTDNVSGGSNNKSADSELRLELAIYNSETGAEMLPFTWAVFRNNHAVVESGGWKFELILARQLWQVDEDFTPVPESEDIDAIILGDIDCIYPVSYEGIYLKENDEIFESTHY